MASSTSLLTPAQAAVLEEFFRRTEAYFLTGGTALAEFYLHHRTSADLDLFTMDDEAFRHGRRLLADVARTVGATLEVVREYPGYAEMRLNVAAESLKVDLVRETAAQIRAEKRQFGLARVDALEDIAANKVATLVGRAEVRDYVDLYFLDQAGHRVADVLPDAQRKDAGVEAATVAWVLGQVRVRSIPDFLRKALTVEELQEFVDRAAAELARASFPGR